MEVSANPAKSSPHAADNLGNSQRPGAYLRQIRLAQKKELSEISKALNIPEKQLIALEKDDYEQLPEAPFIKGYYRSYAKLLNVDGASVTRRFDELYHNDTGLSAKHTLKNSPIQMMGTLRRGRSKQKSRAWLKALLILAIVAVLLGVAVSLIKDWQAKRAAQQADTAQSTVLQPLDTAPPATPHSYRVPTLSIQFKQPTAVRVSDSTGKMLAQGRQSDPLVLEGQAPFSIRIDDTSAVQQFKLNDEVIDLARFSNQSGVADFRLSP